MRRYAFLIALFVSLPGKTALLSLAVPGEKWALRFESPELTKIKEVSSGNGYAYTGTADRMNLSLFVETPTCPGGDAIQNIYKCFGEKIQHVPYVVNGSIAAFEAPDGLQVTYLMQVPSGEKSYRMFNLHFLFARNGKWGDLHISVVQPSKSDLEIVTSLVKSLTIVEAKE
jgi:hypothetical protein